MKAAVRGKEAPALNVCIKNNPEKSPINNGATCTPRFQKSERKSSRKSGHGEK